MKRKRKRMGLKISSDCATWDTTWRPRNGYAPGPPAYLNNPDGTPSDIDLTELHVFDDPEPVTGSEQAQAASDPLIERWGFCPSGPSARDCLPWPGGTVVSTVGKARKLAALTGHFGPQTGI
jgi:hypothetical protein